MKVIETDIPDVKIIEPKVFSDERGFFMETWNARSYAEIGLDVTFVQDNHSRSAKGVLRGMHYQMPRAQGKLLRVMAGSMFDVAVDLRRSSPTFGRWVGIVMAAAENRLLWVPPGFAHGFLSLEDGTDLIYKCADFYAPEYECILAWDDPDVNIKWPLEKVGPPILSGRDVIGNKLKELEVYP